MKLWTLVLGLTLGSGCVSMKKYENLEDRFQKSQNRVERLEAQVARHEAMAQARLQQLRELQADFKPLIDRGVLEIEVVDGRIVLGMAADVLFPSGSSALSPTGKENVSEVGRLLAKKSEYEFQVEGHTDNDAISTPQFANNWYLGAARSIEVVSVLIQSGMSPENLSAASFAEYAPVTSNSTAASKARNRRIEIVLLPDLGELPGYQQLMEQKERPARKRKPGQGQKGQGQGGQGHGG